MFSVIKELSILLFLLLSLTGVAQERNFQIWNLTNLEVKLTPKTSLGITEKIHYTPEAGHIDLKLGDISVEYSLTDWFKVGGSGRLLWIKKENEWLQEQRPMIYGNLGTCLGKVDFDLSNRIEYRMFKSLANHFRHRQMFSVELPPFNTSWFTVYVAEEGYYRFDSERLHLARLHTGTRLKYKDSFEVKMYYVFQKSKRPSYWDTTDVLGFNLNVEL